MKALFVLALISVAFAGLVGLSPSVQLVSVDPNTAKTTVIGDPVPYEAQSQQLASYDAKNQIYYFIGYNTSNQDITLIGLDAKTGSIKSENKLPFISSIFVGVGESCNVDPVTGNVFVSGIDPASQLHAIYNVNPKTGAMNKITTIGDIDVLGAASAYDPVHGILWLQFALNGTSEIDLFGFDVKSGQIKYQLKDTLFMETMSFDPVTGKIYGVGLQIFSETNYTRILMTLDVDTPEKFTIVSKIPGYFIIQAAITALDTKQRRLYCYLQPVGKQSNPFELVGIDLKTGKVVTHPASNDASRPWSLEYI